MKKRGSYRVLGCSFCLVSVLVRCKIRPSKSNVLRLLMMMMMMMIMGVGISQRLANCFGRIEESKNAIKIKILGTISGHAAQIALNPLAFHY